MGREYGMTRVFPRFSLSHWALSKWQALCCPSLHVFYNWKQSHFIACLQPILIQAFRITAIGPSTQLPLRNTQDEFHSAS